MSLSETVNEFQVYINKLEDGVKQLKKEVLKEEVCAQPLELHSEDSLDVLLHNKLKLQSEIEAILDSDLKLLPENGDILLKLVQEQGQEAVPQMTRALQYQKEVNQKLKNEHNKLKQQVQNAKAINSKLTDLIENQSDEDIVASLKQKHFMYGEVFRELRASLHWYLNSRFPLDDNNSLSLEDVLEKVTKQFLKDPNDPYVTFDQEVKELLTLLIAANLVLRHPQDPTKYRLLDFRIN